MYVLLSEGVCKPEVAIDGIHLEGDCVEVLGEGRVESPLHVGEYIQVRECPPLEAQLHAPIALDQFVREVVGGTEKSPLRR